MSSGIDLVGPAHEPTMRRPTTPDSDRVDELWCGQELESRTRLSSGRRWRLRGRSRWDARYATAVRAALLLLLAPVLLVIAMAARLDGGSVFFRHSRVNLGGRTSR